MPQVRPFPPLLLIAASLALASCSTTRGSGYGSSVSEDAAAVAAAKRRQAGSAPPPGQGGGAPTGGVDWEKDEKKEGSESLMVELLAAMVRAATTGYLAIEGLPPGAAVLVDGSLAAVSPAGTPDGLSAGHAGDSGGEIILALQAGPHRIRVEAFGYETWELPVAIEVQRSSRIEPRLSPLAFGLERLRLEPASLPSASPGTFGRLSISFLASAPGEILLEIFDDRGRLVHRGESVRLVGAENRLAWDPPDRLGVGSYRARVSGEGLSLEAPFEIVELRSMSAFSPPLGAVSGTLLAPDARILPSGRGSVAVGGAAVLDPRQTGSARMPLFGGMRMSLGLAEISFSGLAVLYPGYDFAVSPDWGSIGGGIKIALLAERDRALALAFSAAHGSYFAAEAAPSWDGLARFPGVDAGLVLESDGRAARAFVSGHLHASDYYPGWSGSAAVPGFFAWAYLRGGLELYSGDFLGGEATAAVSLAARSAPFGDGLSFAFPISAGLELHHYPRNSPMILSVYGLGEWAGLNDFYLGAGLGVGFAF